MKTIIDQIELAKRTNGLQLQDRYIVGRNCNCIWYDDKLAMFVIDRTKMASKGDKVSGQMLVPASNVKVAHVACRSKLTTPSMGVEPHSVSKSKKPATEPEGDAE